MIMDNNDADLVTITKDYALINFIYGALMTEVVKCIVALYCR
jgi:hypothetical protein